ITLSGGGGSIAPFTTSALGMANVSGGLVSIGSGTLTLSGANTFSGGLTIKSGTVSGTTSSLAFGTVNNVITIGDTSGSFNATLNAGLASTFLNPITTASGNTGTATITDSAAAIFSGAITLSNHDLQLLGGASNLTLIGGVSGTGNLT